MTSFQTAIILLALNACALAGADFFPLQNGNTWTYREATTGQTFTVRVGQPVTIAGNVYYKLSGYAESDLLARVEPVYGALVYWDETRSQDILLTSSEQFEGGYWIAPFRPCPEQVGQGQLQRGNPTLGSFPERGDVRRGESQAHCAVEIGGHLVGSETKVR